MSEPTNRQTVTISQGQVTVIATIALIFAVFVSSLTLAVSVIMYDRARMLADSQIDHRNRIELLEIRERKRTEKETH